MTKTEQKQIIKKITNILNDHDYTIIKPSIYFDEDNCLLLNAFDSFGNVSNLFYDYNDKYASIQSLSPVMVHEAYKCSHWFF